MGTIDLVRAAEDVRGVVEAHADEAERIRRKLEVGLDQVLKEEGAEPLAVANGAN